MQIPSYSVTSEMLEILVKIEAQRVFFTSLKLPRQIKQKIQRVSLLKSSLFSARIEGNPLEFSDLRNEKKEKQMEVFNIVKAVNFIDKTVKKENITKNMLLQLHSQTLKDISSGAGHFRQEVSAIFNQGGIAVYMPPPPSDIRNLLDVLLAYVNTDSEKFPLILAFVAHLFFEKIHPFLDGNGRVGRLLISAVLKAKGWNFTFTIPFEEYLDEHKDEYYFYLDHGLQDTNGYLIFMLKAFLAQIEKVKEQINDELSKKGEFLSPRQEEIYNIIKDHIVISFDIIRRRFLKVPERTLRYDLKKLLDKEIIEKSGETRGRYYRAKK